MSDEYNSVPPASSNRYGEMDEQEAEQQADNQQPSNNSQQADNSSQKRKGDNEKSKSKGDKEHNGKNGDDDEEEKSKAEKKLEKKGTKKIAKQAAAQAKEAIVQGIKQGVTNSVKSVVNIAKQIPKVVGQAIVGAVVGFGMMIIGALSGAVASITPVSDTATVYENMYIAKGAIGANNTNPDTEQLKREVARSIWSVMSGLYTIDDPDGAHDVNRDGSEGPVTKVMYGLRPEQICAMLGNFEVESGLDPTAVETIFGDDFNIGPSKQMAIMNDFICTAWSNWTGGGMTGTARKSYFASHPTIYKCGIGLAQWTDTVTDSNGDGSYENEWSIENPGRNTKLLTYAKLYGLSYLLNKNSAGWNGEKWVVGSADVEAQWYDVSVQLAYMLDTSSVGDSQASWLWNWSTIGEDFWCGDKLVELKATTMGDNVIEGWDSNNSFSTDTGWNTSGFIIKDDKVTFDEEVRPIGDTTRDSSEFALSDSVLKSDMDSTGDAYYLTSNDTYNAKVKYDTWEPAKAIDTSWDFTEGTTTYSGASAAHDLAFKYAEKSADAAWHGRINDVANTNITNYYAPVVGEDILIDNDPRTYDMSGYQTYYTAAQAAANNIEELRLTTWHYTCSTPEHDHSSGCNTSACSHSCGSGCCSLRHPHTGSHNTNSCSHSCGSGCCSLYHQHHGGGPGGGGGCSWDWDYKAGYVKAKYADGTVKDPCDVANDKAKQEYINCFKYIYRYHLYRYMALYYTAQFQIEYEGCDNNSTPNRQANTSKWFNLWWSAGDDSSLGLYAEPNVYARENPTSNAYGFDDYFFRTEMAYAKGVLTAAARTKDSLTNDEKKNRIYTVTEKMKVYENRRSFISNAQIAESAALLAWPTIDLSQMDAINTYMTRY